MSITMFQFHQNTDNAEGTSHEDRQTFLHASKVLNNNSYRNSQQDATVYQNLLFHVYMKHNMFRATHRPSSGAQNCTSSLWFCIRERLLDVVVAGR
jgi:hypothetical protein